MLLTGYTDIESAIAAVNDGQIFRFLTKPCPPPTLLAAMRAATAQHDLITAERVLLEQTVRGSIHMLTDVLSLVSPTAFGRATRIRQLANRLAAQLGRPDSWRLEVAAMLSQIGCMVLPPQTAEKIYYGFALTPEEQTMAQRLPGIAEHWLSNIPRLEEIRDILAACWEPVERKPSNPVTAADADILRVAIDFDALESAQGNTARNAIQAMYSRADAYDPTILEALAAIHGWQQATTEIREVPLAELRVGMILMQDVKSPAGVLLVARGYEVTERFLERLYNLPRGAFPGEKVRVQAHGAPGQLRAAKAAAAAAPA
jgi:response regulator RpfG family c-di-GMP phosphodiesterase